MRWPRSVVCISFSIRDRGRNQEWRADLLILDGKQFANEICEDLKTRVDKLLEHGISPELVVVTTGDSDAGAVYAKSKEKMAKRLGIKLVVKHYDALSRFDFESIINQDIPVIFQTPIVGDIDYWEITMRLPPNLDVEGISAANVTNLAIHRPPAYYPCTPAAVIALLKRYEIELEGQTVCMIGRSNTVGRPLARMLEHRNATVILCHSKTPKHVLMQCMRASDIIVSATGYRNILTAKDVIDWGIWLNDKVLIDVGINRDDYGKVCGDFEPDIFHFCKAYTPVPGGVGPVTTALLISNVVQFYEEYV